MNRILIMRDNDLASFEEIIKAIVCGSYKDSRYIYEIDDL